MKKRKNYDGLSIAVVYVTCSSVILRASIEAQAEMDVTVEPFEAVRDADGNDFFKVTFE